jgi:hypothetical protein
MTSPPTPSRLAPTCPSAYRFKHIFPLTEWSENYHPGELHPVNLGDRFKNGRYRVLRKLGYGAHSSVSLARDEQVLSQGRVLRPNTKK